MRSILSILISSVFLIACQPKADNSANEVFKKNSKTVISNLNGFQNENLDYSMYAKDFVLFTTGFGATKDSINLDEMKASDKRNWAALNFKLLTSPPVLLPGVNANTKLPDGSVRYYGKWEVTLPATDSTEARSGIIKYYGSYDFDDQGKIIYQQGYGDFGGLLDYLFNKKK